jgi:hypothetical protein
MEGNTDMHLYLESHRPAADSTSNGRNEESENSHWV